MTYTRFAAMIATSTVVMFGLMYLNTYAFDHVTYSQTRIWMALLMGAVMAMIMMGFMASRTSERAHIRDPRVRELADEIIEAQVREIAQMKALIADLEANRHRMTRLILRHRRRPWRRSREKLGLVAPSDALDQRPDRPAHKQQDPDQKRQRRPRAPRFGIGVILCRIKRTRRRPSEAEQTGQDVGDVKAEDPERRQEQHHLLHRVLLHAKDPLEVGITGRLRRVDAKLLPRLPHFQKEPAIGEQGGKCSEDGETHDFSRQPFSAVTIDW